MSCLLESAWRFGMVVDEDLALRSPGELPLRMMDSPFQRVRHEVRMRARARLGEAVATARPSLNGADQLDPGVTYHLCRGWEAAGTTEASGILKLLLVGGLWTDEALYKAGLRQDARCVLCGAEQGNLEHLFGGGCPTANDVRTRMYPKLSEVDPARLPP